MDCWRTLWRNERATAATRMSVWVTFTLCERSTSGTRRVRTLRRLTGQAGRNRVSSLGRGLAPGRYFLTVTAANAEGSVSRALGLRVARRK